MYANTYTNGSSDVKPNADVQQHKSQTTLTHTYILQRGHESHAMFANTHINKRWR